jgi:hypothetical protein
MTTMRVAAFFCFLLLPTLVGALPEGVEQTLVLAPSAENPRNSEGDFIALQDGRVLFVYTKFVGGAGDHDNAVLASRESKDGGATWTADDRIVVTNEAGMNVMSVSLLRLQDGRIALLYLRKNATDDCMPMIRYSSDEAESWTAAQPLVDAPVGYYVVNNDRMVQVSSGRLVVPAARHALKGEPLRSQGRALCFLSDDAGATWRLSTTILEPPDTTGNPGLQEPAVVELKDGRLLMLLRTGGGCQYRSYSEDGGETWSAVEPTEILSPVSPASIERIPGTGELLLIWNDHSGDYAQLGDKRSPMAMAFSADDGQTWQRRQILEDNPHGWYCYTAMLFAGDHLLLGYCAGDRRENNGLALTQVIRMPVSLLAPH